MPEIRILPEEVIHKIAAGEVVERPLSVVKELVENSLDAGATSIHVDIEQGGIRSIIVTDNGIGIPPQQLSLALKRHATSKIQSAEDLFSLRTMGFRGEALSSIAGISHFNIESATSETAPLGYSLEVLEGKLSGLKEVAMSRGTRISVRDLFCTTPARLKFLKRPETEWGHIYDLLVAMSLRHLSVEWTLTHNGKRSLFSPSAKDQKSRILDLFDADTEKMLYPVEREISGFKLHGLIGHPNFSNKTNRNIFLYVNGRWVQDRLIQHAILTGYRGILMTQQYPMVILNLEIDPALVDVNVHPTKREVRFSNSNMVHQIVSQVIREKLDQAPWKEKTEKDQVSPLEFFRETPRVQSLNFSYHPPRHPGEIQDPFSTINSSFQKNISEELNAGPLKTSKIGTLAYSSLRLIGQLHLTYLLCENEGSLVLIDQHAAHERIGFEKLKNSYLSGELAAQRLLHPISFNLPERESVRLRSCLVELEKFGFLVDEFGENSFVLKGSPNLLAGSDGVVLLQELVSSHEEEEGTRSLQERLDHVLATMACHRQIRAGDRLQHEEMTSLLQELEGTPRSYHCPHGRPVMIEIESREIEKWFKRVV